jgi:hypothetical protein
MMKTGCSDLAVFGHLVEKLRPAAMVLLATQALESTTFLVAIWVLVGHEGCSARTDSVTAS